jgi:hypothetical protein
MRLLSQYCLKMLMDIAYSHYDLDKTAADSLQSYGVVQPKPQPVLPQLGRLLHIEQRFIADGFDFWLLAGQFLPKKLYELQIVKHVGASR